MANLVDLAAFIQRGGMSEDLKARVERLRSRVDRKKLESDEEEIRSLAPRPSDSLGIFKRGSFVQDSLPKMGRDDPEDRGHLVNRDPRDQNNDTARVRAAASRQLAELAPALRERQRGEVRRYVRNPWEDETADPEHSDRKFQYLDSGRVYILDQARIDNIPVTGAYDGRSRTDEEQAYYNALRTLQATYPKGSDQERKIELLKRMTDNDITKHTRAQYKPHMDPAMGHSLAPWASDAVAAKEDKEWRERERAELAAAIRATRREAAKKSR